jgi:hypothetical protein
MTNIIRNHRIADALDCVWIQTGNPRQPLACVWMENEAVLFRHARETRTQSEGERACR